MIHPVKFEKPYLVMGYDWERCGREGDLSHKIQNDRQLAQKGLRIISQAHQEYDAPFTLFVLGKMLERPELCASLLKELESHHLPPSLTFKDMPTLIAHSRRALMGTTPWGAMR